MNFSLKLPPALSVALTAVRIRAIGLGSRKIRERSRFLLW